MPSNCINEIPGDWNWSCRGLVKLGFRNPSFGNAVLWFPEVKEAAMLRGAALQHPLVSCKHVALSPCTAPGLALTVSPTNVTLPLGLPG